MKTKNSLKKKNLFLVFLKNYSFIIIIWAIGLFLRCYRQNELLGFYFDQGRDAKMAADIISLKNFPAIGPTTGIEGLFLGPFWYYLIVPGYIIGHGDPAIASYFIAFLESLTIPLIYFLLKKYWSFKSAILGSVFWAFSHYLIRSSRWFSNPSSLPLFVVLIIWFLTKIFKEKKSKYWPWVFLLVGFSLQLEAASAIFFIPIIIVLSLLNISEIKKVKFKTWFFSAISFGVLLLPQLAFEIKNKFLITKNFIGFLTGRVNSNTGKSWAIPTLDFALKRIFDYYNNFFSKLDTNVTWVSVVFLAIFVIGLVFLIVKNLKNKFLQILLCWLFVPLILLLFFVGNYGNLYDYYLTGFFPAFIMLFALAIASYLSYFSIAIVFYLFYTVNIPALKNYITAGPDGPQHITLANEKWAVLKVCNETKSKDYNVDIYVPPVITHAYDYLFNWYIGQHKCHSQNVSQVSLLYTIYEVDPPHPERLDVWLKRQSTIGKILKEEKFGGIVVQERERIKYEKQ